MEPHKENTALCYTCTQTHTHMLENYTTICILPPRLKSCLEKHQVFGGKKQNTSCSAQTRHPTRTKILLHQKRTCLHSHSRRARSLRVVLRVDLWRRHLWVAWGLWIRGTDVALRGRRGFIIIAKVVFLLIPVEAERQLDETDQPSVALCVCVCVLPGRCVGVARVPGAALAWRPAPIMQWGLRAVVRRTASCYRKVLFKFNGCKCVYLSFDKPH